MILSDDLTEPTLSLVLNCESPPTTEEVSTAVKKLKNGKVPGVDGIPPEMIKAGGPFVEVLAKLFKLTWISKNYPNDFYHSETKALYKKGETT